MRSIQALFIFTLTLSSFMTYELNYDYTWDMTDCGEDEEMPNDKFANLSFYFSTKMDNDLKSHLIGPLVSIPCEKGHEFTVQFEVIGNGGTIEMQDSNEAPTLYNGAANMTNAMDVESSQEYIEETLMTMQDVVVKASVDVKMKSAVIKLETANSFMVKRLEEYGVDYEVGKTTYVLSESMKEELKEKLAAKTQSKVQYYEIPANISQDMIRQLMQGQTKFTEVDGNKKMQVTVQRKVYKQNPDGSMTEVILD